MSQDLDDISNALRVQYRCHTAILYGSRAAGDSKPASDYDVAGFANVATVERIAGQWRASYVDAFIYPEERLAPPDQELLPLRGGVVLFERDGAGTRLLGELEGIYATGPVELSGNEANIRRRWAWKMLERAESQDPEGNFRRAWLLTALLEDYFALRTMWYEGPKKSLAYLSRECPEVHGKFVAALMPGAPIDAVRHAVVATVGERGSPLDDGLGHVDV